MTVKQPHKPSLQDFSGVPTELRSFLQYLVTVRNLSINTVNAYFIDLRTFFRYLKKINLNISDDVSFNEIDISDVPFQWVQMTTTASIYDYLFFISEVLQNSPKTRARKLSSLKAFYKYLTVKVHFLEEDPSKTIEIPSLKKTLPKYLSLEESISLLKSVDTEFSERDYCILTLFLNCGMRLNELIGINISDFKDDTIRIVGKGNKERLVYLNESCIYALDNYIIARSNVENIKDKDALFISARRGTRLSGRRVEQIVADCLQKAGFGGRGYSPHKLRHTAATLMYRFGNVDMLALKEILGHEHVTTTEIYTHISTDQLKNAVSSSPLSDVKIDISKQKNTHKKNKES